MFIIDVYNGIPECKLQSNQRRILGCKLKAFFLCMEIKCTEDVLRNILLNYPFIPQRLVILYNKYIFKILRQNVQVIIIINAIIQSHIIDFLFILVDLKHINIELLSFKVSLYYSTFKVMLHKVKFLGENVSNIRNSIQFSRDNPMAFHRKIQISTLSSFIDSFIQQVYGRHLSSQQYRYWFRHN